MEIMMVMAMLVALAIPAFADQNIPENISKGVFRGQYILLTTKSLRKDKGVASTFTEAIPFKP